MKKIKHSKFKNTGFIFELLVRQVTAEIMSSNNSISEKILKEFFNSKRELSKELKLLNKKKVLFNINQEKIHILKFLKI